MRLSSTKRLHQFTLALVAAALALAASRLDAQDTGSYVTPFPQGDSYILEVVGDSLAEGVLYGLREEIGRDSQVQVGSAVGSLSRITFNTFDQKLAELRAELLTKKAHIGVVMLGVQDQSRIAAPDGKRHAFGAPEWRAEYARRVDEMIKTLKGAGIALYWVGLPNMRDRAADSAAQIINDIIRERAYINGIKFIDIYSSFADEQGAYSAFGPDTAGNEKRMRWRDGVHFTGTGYAKVAHYVAREFRRDVAQAKSERTIPLAGSETEQAAVRAAVAPAPENDEAALTGWQADVEQTKQKLAEQQVPGAFFMNAAGGEQSQENGRINLKAVGANGREQIVSLEILRPAIPASVVALVTRKQSRARNAQIGDTLVDETTNGISIMSTITPASDSVISGNRRKLSLAQTPFFRVLVKGERLEPRSGRADDFAWPRPELPAPPVVVPAALDNYEADAEGGIPLPFPSPFRPRA
ncbi:MAG: hypothetical protein APF80_08595 [Alphaproteobacteria bacterium BRH_c36]|nr:MAG: hypothetical protein APF80_08595 [Alphaproteobacteria bacterium BRH_c36]